MAGAFSLLLLPLAAFLVGFGLFSQFPAWPSNEVTARYMAIAVLAGLDTVVGGVRAFLSGNFDDAVFISGFFVNALLAVGLVMLGERLGLETGIGDGRISVMMIGAVVLFTSRILDNLAALRRLIIARRRDAATKPSGVISAPQLP